jgi:ABC-type uncharacterized transport system substrate-binding protein
MMERRAFVAGSLGLLAAPLAAGAQLGKVIRIGVLDAGSAAVSSAHIESFRQGLHALGRTEGALLKIEWRFAEAQGSRLLTLAMELIALKPDVLMSPHFQGIRTLRNATTTIPIVMAGSDYLGTSRSFAETLARPGGNITGVLSLAPDLEGKRMELLREAVPVVSRVATFWDADNFPYRAGETVKTRPERWGFTFIPVAVRSADEFESAFAAAKKEGAAALSLQDTPFFHTHRQRLAALAVKHRVAWIAADREYAEAGCLMSYGADPNDLIRRAGTYVDKILKGAKPADLPIEQPTKFELVINLRTAKALGLTIPPSVLARADEVIQ